ncbi:hypothetical protein F5Y04DRAFT_259635 [Hypomontagnella monticulosa]|nr:hypothetical protein F5Y04DRAFT_259635 [Hypomontagnella monticulosa]
MPITIRTADHPPREWMNGAASASSTGLLRESCPSEHAKCKEIIQSSFGALSAAGNIFPSSNGFVRAAYAAYSKHHHLKIRPEDVWFSILTQFSFYVNANAEELRSHFVAHGGQKELEVRDTATIKSADFGKLAVWMTHRIEENVVDPELRNWIMPDFTTTTPADTVTAAVLMMGSMQKYFTYKMSLDCGMPSVTLLGEREDWVKIRRRLDYLPKLGEEAAQFSILLIAVLDYFVRSFDEPNSPEVRSFWSRIAHESSGSGPFYLSGWITAFCFWSVEGECLYKPPQGRVKLEGFDSRNPGCDLDGTLFHKVNTDNIPDAFVSVPVKVDDNGDIHHTRMVAGSVGIGVSSSGDILEPPKYYYSRKPIKDLKPEEKKTGLDTLQPVSGWWMYELIPGSDSKPKKSAPKRVKNKEPDPVGGYESYDDDDL